MKRIVSRGWFEMDRLKAIRAIVESHYERKSGGLEAETIKAIWYVVTEEADKLNELAGDALKDYVELNDN